MPSPSRFEPSFGTYPWTACMHHVCDGLCHSDSVAEHKHCLPGPAHQLAAEELPEIFSCNWRVINKNHKQHAPHSDPHDLQPSKTLFSMSTSTTAQGVEIHAAGTHPTSTSRYSSGKVAFSFRVRRRSVSPASSAARRSRAALRSAVLPTAPDVHNVAAGARHNLCWAICVGERTSSVHHCAVSG